MKIACIGGGPAGLYLGILIKHRAPAHDVVVYERNRANETFGFGVVFSDATLDNLEAADPISYAQITSEFARWDDIAIHAGGEVLRSTGHGFCGLERRALLQILQRRAADLGVRVEYERTITSLDEVADADLVVACDGVGSWVRDALADQFEPDVDVRPNKFVWLGCTVPYDAFTFIFKPSPHGLFRVHAYRYHADGSTFIVECREDTWRAAGLDTADEDATVRILEGVFADELAGHRLIKNHSIWRNFPTVRCGRWHAGNVVLLGDAVHTAHFSIGSGTKLAMEDAIVLCDELLAHTGTGDAPDLAHALAAYELRRRPEVEALQAAAQASLEWFEGTERYATMSPTELTYSLMTRSLRVSHASMVKRDPALAHGVERLLAARAGVTTEPPPSPTALPLTLGDRTIACRIAIAPMTPERVASFAAKLAAGDSGIAEMLGAIDLRGAGMLVSRAMVPRAMTAKAAEEARAFLGDARTHGTGMLQAVRLELDAAVTTDGMLDAVRNAARAGFDLLILDPGDEPLAIERLPARLAEVRAAWRDGGWIAAVIHDRPTARAAVVGHGTQLVRAGANLLWVTAPPDDRARLPAAPLADRLRNELGVATCLVATHARLADLDAAIAAGRADLVAIDRMPTPTTRSN